ncbi:hypothetical protein MLD38_028310 [Melastoma candidum]|uniref:Uncharacterized protein n=1 Tax=Melastoma candidum TaxID=119954 RepID=A0ACB9N2W1_9MYRT|nr:hypothetical protein MLD38_028310 [Melastoma candidum]
MPPSLRRNNQIYSIAASSSSSSSRIHRPADLIGGCVREVDPTTVDPEPSPVLASPSKAVDPPRALLRFAPSIPDPRSSIPDLS